MESRVMGNCHARFGAGENLEERICSLRLHIPIKGLPIAILYHDCRSHENAFGGDLTEESVCCTESHCRSVGKDIHRPVAESKGSCRRTEVL